MKDLTTPKQNKIMDRREFIQASGWSLLGLAATGSLLHGCTSGSREAKKIMPSASDYRIFWGDLHNHCNITYGHGDMKDAFEAAKGQLDFVSVTPHAMWPDIETLKDDPRLTWVIGYHTDAFRRLREGNYRKYVRMTNEYNREGEFLTFIGYEAHSLEHGDHVALNYDLDAPLVECTSIEDWKRKARGHKVFITPHHMGYQTGYRGYNWKFFTDGDQTPFVEMYSRHGLAESDMGDYPYLHDHDYWEFPIVLTGEIKHTINGSCQIFDKNTAYLIRPKDCHLLEKKSDTLSMLNILMRDSFVRKMCSCFSEDLYDNLLKFDYIRITLDDKQTTELFNSVYALQENSNDDANYQFLERIILASIIAKVAQLSLTVNVRFTNNVNHNEDFEQQFTATASYETTQSLNSVQEELVSQMIDDLVDQIFNATVANW